MRSLAFTGASAFVFLASSVQGKHDVHERLQAIHRRHSQEREYARHTNETLVKRGTCSFPTSAGLVAVTPSCGNGGWAFATDQTCYAGRYCPYACPPGQVSMQWDPSVTSYTYPGSMNGGLLCNSDGTLSKPYPSRPYCQSTAANIGVRNTCGENVAFCQTVLPGDEDMLIPTNVISSATLAVPGPDYWASTAAHYYINPPGVSSTDGCVWGSTANPYGNWAPYVAGANVDSTGATYIKLGWNPVYLEEATPFRNTMPTWGVKIECPNGGCSGLPCSIDPSVNKVNEMTGSVSTGAGGGAFCVVTVASGSTANFVVFTPGSSTTSTTSSATAQWTNINQAGQFYQSNLLSTSTSVSGLSNATASVSKASSSSYQSASSDYSASATDTSSGPTGEPNYELFSSAAAEPTASVSSVDTSTTFTSAIAKHTGGASTIDASLAAIVLGVGAMLL